MLCSSITLNLKHSEFTESLLIWKLNLRLLFLCKLVGLVDLSQSCRIRKWRDWRLGMDYLPKCHFVFWKASFLKHETLVDFVILLISIADLWLTNHPIQYLVWNAKLKMNENCYLLTAYNSLTELVSNFILTFAHKVLYLLISLLTFY